MFRGIGIVMGDRIVGGLVEDKTIVGPLVISSVGMNEHEQLHRMPVEHLVHRLKRCIDTVSDGREVQAIGVALPGIVLRGLVQESVILQQLKGSNLKTMLSQLGVFAPVLIFNDADAVAAGAAAAWRRQSGPTRVWLLGNGIGYGRYPSTDGIFEAGHSVVTLDPHENLCACGGRGHLEGIMGQYAMRRRFFDKEPEEIFARADAGDSCCITFVRLWHRALAAATASIIHMDGPGQFYVGGPNAIFVTLRVLDGYLQEMVTVSSLQGSSFKVISITDELGIIGSAVSASDAYSGIQIKSATKPLLDIAG